MIKDITMERGLLAVQGPKAIDLLQNFTDFNLFDMKSYSFQILKLGDVDNILLSSTGYTGSGGVELYVPRQYAVKIWQDLFSHNSILEMEGKLNAKYI